MKSEKWITRIQRVLEDLKLEHNEVVAEMRNCDPNSPEWNGLYERLMEVRYAISSFKENFPGLYVEKKYWATVKGITLCLIRFEFDEDYWGD